MLQLREMKQVLAQEGIQSQLERVKRELNILAAECNNAFLKAEMQLSQHPQIGKLWISVHPIQLLQARNQ